MKPDFNFSHPLVPIRILLGLLFIPHIAFKLANLPGSVAFFGKAGFEPPAAFVMLAIAMETISAFGLISGILTKWVGLLAAAVMCTATVAVLQTVGMVWLEFRRHRIQRGVGGDVCAGRNLCVGGRKGKRWPELLVSAEVRLAPLLERRRAVPT